MLKFSPESGLLKWVCGLGGNVTLVVKCRFCFTCSQKHFYLCANSLMLHLEADLLASCKVFQHRCDHSHCAAPKITNSPVDNHCSLCFTYKRHGTTCKNHSACLKCAYLVPFFPIIPKCEQTLQEKNLKTLNLT